MFAALSTDDAEDCVLDDFLLQSPANMAPTYDSLEGVRNSQDPTARAAALQQVLVNCAGGPGVAPLSNYCSFFLNITSPQCFPFVLAGQRPDGMSETEYGKLFCRRMHYRGAPPAPGTGRHLLAQNGEALAILFDTKLLHDASLRAAIVVKNSPHHLNAVAGLSREQVKAAAIVLGGDRRSAARREALQQIPAGVASFAAALQAVGSRVEGSNAMCSAGRMRAAALDSAVGYNTLHFNANPNDLSNRIVAVSAGEAAPCTSDGRPLFTEDMHRRLRRVAAYPMLCAAYLRVVAEAVLWIIFGFRPDDKTQRNPSCYMGTVQYVSYKVEESGRRALHFHGAAVVPAFRTSTVKTVFGAGGDGAGGGDVDAAASGTSAVMEGLRARIADIMEAVACQFMPEPYECPPAAFVYRGARQRQCADTAPLPSPIEVPFPAREDYPDQTDFRRFCRHALRADRRKLEAAELAATGGAPSQQQRDDAPECSRPPDQSPETGDNIPQDGGCYDSGGRNAASSNSNSNSTTSTETDWSELDCGRADCTTAPSAVPALGEQALRLIAWHLCRLIMKRQYHTHTSTCFKYDTFCRMDYPRKLQMLFRWVAELEAVVLPRCGENLVGFTPALLLALGCNNNTTLTCDLGRETAKYDDWQQKPPADREPCPVAAGEDRARRQSDYQTKYALKAQGTVNVDAFLRAVARLVALEPVAAAATEAPAAATIDAPDSSAAAPTGEPQAATPASGTSAPTERTAAASTPVGRPPPMAAPTPTIEQKALLANLRSAIHTTTGQNTYGMALMSHVLNGGTTLYQSFDTAPLAVAPFVELINTGAHHTTDCLHQVVLDRQTGGLRYTTAVRDYLLRESELHGPTCSPYTLSMAYRKEVQDSAYHRQVAQPHSRPMGRRKRRAPTAFIQECNSDADDEKRDTSSEDEAGDTDVSGMEVRLGAHDIASKTGKAALLQPSITRQNVLKVFK